MSEVTLHTTGFGRDAAMLLRRRISVAKADDPLRPVSVVVPTNYVGVSTRRLLASGQLGPVTAQGNGIAGLTLLTVYRLAELLGAAALAATGRRPVSMPVIAAAVRGVLEDAPGIFEPVRDHPSTEEALVRAHRELSEVRPESLDLLAAQSPRADDVVRIHRAVRSRLEAGWYEEVDLMAAARDAVAGGPSVLEDLGTVIVYLPQDLSIPAADLIRTLANRTSVEIVAALTGYDDADRDVLRTLNRLGAPPATHPQLTPPVATQIVSVSDPEEEVRSAVDVVIAAARDGVALESMAVLYPAPEPYARIVHEQLSAAGIPYSGRSVRPLADRLAGRWLLDLLELPDERFARPAVMSLLTEAPVRDRDGRYVASGVWERISREAGIVHDRDEWRRKLSRYAKDQQTRAEDEASGPEPRDWLVDRRASDAARARDLRDFLDELFDSLETARTLSRWGQLADWCRRTLVRYLGAERHRLRWPEVEQQAADRVDEALDRLAGLDEVDPDTDLRTFRRTLQLELDDDLGRVGEFGRGVLVGTTSTALGVDLELVAVLGLAEGVFPTRPREDSLLPDAERATIVEELRPRAGHVGVEHRHLLAALAASRGLRLLTYPRGDLRRSVEQAPSRWLLDSVEALRDDQDDDRRALPPAAPWLRSVPSFAGRVRTVPFPATRQEYGLRSLAGHPSNTPLDDHPLVAGDAPLARGARLVTERRSGRFTRFDGNLARVAGDIRSPAGDRPVSASQLEAWLDCPHAYLMSYGLKIDPVDNPEELLEISPLDKGTLIHTVLERWLCERLDGPVPGPDQPWPPEALERMRQIAAEVCQDAEDRGVTGHPLLWRRDRGRILGDLERFLAHDDARRRDLRAIPDAAELAFGFSWTDTAAVTIDLGDGRTVAVRGKIDRIDRTDDGTVVVADYKTGGIYDYTDLSAEQPLGDGTKLQLPIYGLALQADDADIEQVRAEYWFATTKGEFKRIGYTLTDDVIDHLRGALRIVVDGIEAGAFPQRPPEPGWSLFTRCRYCDPDELGTADRHRDWERLRQAPPLRDYVAWVEPGVLAGEQPVQVTDPGQVDA